MVNLLDFPGLASVSLTTLCLDVWGGDTGGGSLCDPAAEVERWGPRAFPSPPLDAWALPASSPHPCLMAPGWGNTRYCDTSKHFTVTLVGKRYRGLTGLSHPCLLSPLTQTSLATSLHWLCDLALLSGHVCSVVEPRHLSPHHVGILLPQPRAFLRTAVSHWPTGFPEDWKLLKEEGHVLPVSGTIPGSVIYSSKKVSITEAATRSLSAGPC